MATGDIFRGGDGGFFSTRLGAVVGKCLEMDPGKRYRSAREMEKELENGGMGRAENALLRIFPDFADAPIGKMAPLGALYIFCGFFASVFVYVLFNEIDDRRPRREP